MRMRHLAICGLSGCAIFFHINLTSDTILEIEVIKIKKWILIFYKMFTFWEELREMWSTIYNGFHVKRPLFLPSFNTTWISQQIFEKYSNIKFHENPSSGSRNAPCGRKDGQT